jgi:hypothetical protein
MSLIHDSLRKLETKQVKNAASGFSSPEGSYLNNKSSSAKKLWMILVIIVGIILIYYAYTLLSHYQKQNEILLNDIKQMKSQNVVNNSSQVNSKFEAVEKVIVQQPAVIKKSPIVKMVTSQERQKEVTELNKKLLSVETKAQQVAVVIAKPILPEQTKGNSVYIPKAIKKPVTMNINQTVKKSNRKKKTHRKKVNNHKLTVKQTRQLVNNLQMQMELKNSDEVNGLLKKLAQSSGEGSLVYLRMKAYWSNINDDKATAVVMYKKILFQKPYDIQAGTNLALIEAKAGQKPQALKRLELLKNKYPSNKGILEYLNRIEAN